MRSDNMIIDTENIDHDFTVMWIDGLVLINPSEIGAEVCMERLDEDEIWSSDLICDINEYFTDIVNQSFDKCEDCLHENNRQVDCWK